MSGGKVRTLHDRSIVGLLLGFSLSSDRFSFLSERLSFFYQELAESTRKVTKRRQRQLHSKKKHTMHAGNEMDIRFTATMLYDQTQRVGRIKEYETLCMRTKRDLVIPTRDVISH
jgi:hypothetical protein